MPKEIWKQVAVPRLRDCYKVSNLGRVQSLSRTIKVNPTGTRKGWKRIMVGRILKPCQGSKSNKYMVISMSKDGLHRLWLVHRLILETFVGPCPEGMECCHLNGDPQDNRLENLRWDTPTANAKDREFHGRTAKGWKMITTKTGTEKRWAIVDLHERCRYSIPKLARIFGKTEITISYMLNHPPSRR